ncbi:hypothetical protein SLS53_008039 [Cytospora paraplurivora]|uniref:EXPERA domain-containing protein n=1 Tax=Cytospora paraplurivora TaxID=2898453 RepID=A0AAN9YDB7_9PEZI
MAQTFSVPAHAYYPRDAYIPDYVPNASSVAELIVRFGSLLGITIFTALWIATRFNPRLGLTDKLVFGWFVLFIVSVAHLYGVALYYSTCYVNEKYRGLVYGRPEFLYYWIYYVGFNAPWVIVPAGTSSELLNSGLCMN